MRARIAIFVLLAGAALAAPAQETMQMETNAGPVACPGCNLQRVKLEARDYANANFSGANLAGADLRGLTFNGADFGGADLSGAKLDGIKCNGCNLSRAILTGATLTGAELGGADLQFARVDRNQLGAATVTGAAFGPELTASDQPWACGAANLSAITTRIHVAPNGRDSDSCGSSPADPCATIAKGIARCAPAGCGVLVAWGEYQPSSPVALRDGVNVYGGCVAASHARPEYVSVLKGNGGLPAVTSSVKVKTILQGFDVVGTKPANPGAASIAMTVVDSLQTIVMNSRVTAGIGAGGKKGDDGVDGARGGDANARGGGRNASCGNANGGDGEDEITVSVPGDGKCHPSYPNGGRGSSGEMGSTGVSADGGAHGENRCAYCVILRPGEGNRGADGRNAGCGAAGVTSSHPEGSFDGAAWMGIPGGDGGPGGVGGGGGGGGAGGYKGGECFAKAEFPGNRGGGGGAGGCGGGIGRGGQQGGGSFGIVLLRSTIAISDSRIVGGRGGDGGNGGNGARGGAGGSGAGGATNTDGGYGGPGANGGAGGASAGGAGGNSGPSVGVVEIGSTIQQTRVSFLAGASGTPGTHGTGGGALFSGLCTAPNGQDGVSGTVATTRAY